MKKEDYRIVIAEKDTIEMHENIIDEILECINFEDALVTDLSTFSDFSFMDDELDEKIKNAIQEHFGINIKMNDNIAETALKIYHSRKSSKSIH